MSQTLSDGQLPASAGILVTVPSSVSILAASLHNTSSSLTETITLTLTRAASSNTRRVGRYVLAPNESIILQGLPVSPGDILNGSSTDAATVDYVTYSGTGPIEVFAHDSSGSRKAAGAGASSSGQDIITAAVTTALAVGPAGTTNPTFQIDTSTTADVTGIKIKGAAAAAGVAVSVITSGSNESVTLDAAGTGAVKLNSVAGTGAVQIGGAASGVNATGLTITPNTAASGLAVAVVSTGSAEPLTVDAKGTGTISIGGTSTGQVYLGRGAVKAPILGMTITALGTTQNSTPTAAQLLTGIVTQTGATGAGTFTLPSGTTLSTAMPLAPAVGDSFLCWFINVGGAQTITITGATGTTVSGTAAVPSGKFALMLFTNTGANTWNIYCILSA